MDGRELQHALIRLRGFRSHIAGTVTEAMVDEYHSILASLEALSGKDLRTFAVPRPTFDLPTGPRKHSRNIYYSRRDEKATPRYCDQKDFKELIDCVMSRFLVQSRKLTEK
jgi:hypothetical protein